MRFNMSLLVLTFLLPLSASAATYQASQELSLEIPVRDDLYAAGEKVLVKEPVQGDLVLAGGEVTMKADVSQDATIAGGNVTIEADIGDDLRVAGGSVSISGTIGDDLIVFGSNVAIAGDTIVKGDLTVFGDTVTIDGTVRGNLRGRGRQFVILGTVGGTTDVRADSVEFRGESIGDAVLSARTLDVSTSAVFRENLRYWQPQGEYYFGTTRIDGEATYDEGAALAAFDEVKQTALGAFQVALIGIAGYALLSSALVILLLILLTKTYFTDAATRLQTEPWKSLLYGFLYVFLTPLLVVLCVISVIGIPIGLFLFLLYLFTLYYAKAFTAIVLAKWLQKKYNRTWGFWKFFGASVGVYIALRATVAIPLVGWLAVWIAILMAFGAMAYVEWEKYKKVR